MKQFPYADRFIELLNTQCDADDWSMMITSMDGIATRFAQNGITQHIAGKKEEVRLSLSYKNCTGAASINQISEEKFIELIQVVREIALLNPPNPEHMPTLGMPTCIEVSNFDQAVAALTENELVDIIETVVRRAEGMNATLSGMTERYIQFDGHYTKNGINNERSLTDFSHSMTLKRDTVETRVSKECKRYRDFNLEEEWSQLVSQFDSLSNPMDMEAETIPVILRPQAVVDLFSFMLYFMDRRDADNGMSPYSGKLGQQCFGELFNCQSSIAEEDLLIPTYYADGLPTTTIDWIQKGILENLQTSRFYAKEIGAEPKPYPYNVFIPGADTTEEEMMKLVKRGLIINRFWYIRVVDDKSGELTGMTRDGVLYFEDGKIKHAVNNFRFNEIPYLATQRLLALGKSKLVSIDYKVPTMLIDDFHFEDKTSF